MVIYIILTFKGVEAQNILISPRNAVIPNLVHIVKTKKSLKHFSESTGKKISGIKESMLTKN